MVFVDDEACNSPKISCGMKQRKEMETNATDNSLIHCGNEHHITGTVANPIKPVDNL